MVIGEHDCVAQIEWLKDTPARWHCFMAGHVLVVRDANIPEITDRHSKPTTPVASTNSEEEIFALRGLVDDVLGALFYHSERRKK